MKKRIGTKTYNTNTSRLVAYWNNEAYRLEMQDKDARLYAMLPTYEEKLYRKRTGEYFFVHGNNENVVWLENIIPCTEQDAIDFIENKCLYAYEQE